MDETSESSIRHETGDDDWSQHVEADESHFLPSSLRIEAHSELASRPSTNNNSNHDNQEEVHRMTSSLIVEDDIDNVSRSNNPSIIESSPGHHAGDILDDNDLPPSSNLAPQRSEPTLKEKLVERERQRRAETERARLKRQFALSSNNDGGGGADEDEHGFVDENTLRENGSVAGTTGGGSSVAVENIEEEDDDHKLTYPMKRFLQDQGNIIEEEPTPRESPRDVDKGVVMERFLNDQAVATNTTADIGSNVDRSVSFDMEPTSPSAMVLGETHDVPPAASLSSNIRNEQLASFDTSSTDVRPSAATSVANASLICLPPDDEDQRAEDLEGVSNTSALDDLNDRNTPSIDIQSVPESPMMDRSTSSEQPHFLRLTEAEIREMAAIDEASRSNAPPSDRDSISTIGELVSDFGGHVAENALSQGTPTTAMESASIASRDHSNRPLSEDNDDRHSIDELATGSVSSHAFVSSTGGNVSVTANPPSELGGDDEMTPSLVRDEVRHDLGGVGNDKEVPAVSEIMLATNAQTSTETSVPTELQMPGEDCNIVNRMIRPGMVNLKRRPPPSDTHIPSTPIRRSLSAPDSMNFDVDGFDFDKNAPTTPDATREVGPDEMWSPGSRMTPSPYPGEKFQNYGATTTNIDGRVKEEAYDLNQTSLVCPGSMYDGEAEPLMPKIPKEIVASPPRSRDLPKSSNIVDRAFHCLRSEHTASIVASDNEIKEYQERSVFERACSGRVFRLLLTFLLEIPVLLMIVGGSNRLCSVIGREKLQILIGFFPMCSAISGNMGLQTSDLTTRAISEGHLTRDMYWRWVSKEVGASLLLGLGVGICISFVSMYLTSFDFAFGFSIMLVQFLSIVIGALNGSLAPIMFGIIFKADYGKWTNQLATAIQDVLVSFLMMILSYNILLLFSSQGVDPADTCVT